jgi:hypothetical protein
MASDVNQRHVPSKPDLEFRFYLVEFGYQCDVLSDGKPIVEVCRDFAFNHPVAAMRERLYQRLVDAVKDWAQEMNQPVLKRLKRRKRA